MLKLWHLINGNKTYIVGTSMILFALTQYWAGSITGDDAMQMVLTALGLMGIRHGIRKIGA